MGQIVSVVGGSGFVGRHVVRALADAGYVVNVLCRDTVAAAYLKTAGQVGQIVLQHADITRPETLKDKLEGSFAVVNLVSTLYSRGRQSFRALNVEGAAQIATEARLQGVSSLVHISALGVEEAVETHYGSTKVQGEAKVREAFPEAVILRPSLIFGVGDGFFDRFARMSNRSPFLPLIGGGKTSFQPVYVKDVAQAVLACLTHPQVAGKTLDIVGPNAYSMEQMMRMLLDTTERKRMLVDVPYPIASIMGLLGECMPVPPLTRDQVKMLKHPNIAKGKNGLETLGITPTALDAQLPHILARYRPAA